MWILMRWLRRTLDRDGQDWNTMLIVQGIAMLLFFLLMGIGVLAEAEEQVSPEQLKDETSEWFVHEAGSV